MLNQGIDNSQGIVSFLSSTVVILPGLRHVKMLVTWISVEEAGFGSIFLKLWIAFTVLVQDLVLDVFFICCTGAVFIVQSGNIRYDALLHRWSGIVLSGSMILCCAGDSVLCCQVTSHVMHCCTGGVPPQLAGDDERGKEPACGAWPREEGGHSEARADD